MKSLMGRVGDDIIEGDGNNDMSSDCSLKFIFSFLLSYFQIYTNCTCVIESGIPIGNETIQAEGGRCSERCQWQWVFMLMAVGLLTLMFAAVIPAWTATMRYD